MANVGSQILHVRRVHKREHPQSSFYADSLNQLGVPLLLTHGSHFHQEVPDFGGLTLKMLRMTASTMKGIIGRKIQRSSASV